ATGNDVTSCIDGLPACGSSPQSGRCAGNPALGPNDGTTYELKATGRIELGFLCSAIVETGSPSAGESPDFKIFATVPGGARAVVEVSKNGTDYVQLDYLDTNDKTFALERSGFIEVRFVRIADIGNG